MPVDDNSILQADSAVIAGVLILLSLVSFGDPYMILYNLFLRAATAVIIIPFAISAIWIMRARLAHKENSRNEHSRYASESTIIGFGYLIGMILFIAGLSTQEAGFTYHFNGSGSSSSVAMHCAQDLAAFNVSHISQCSKFSRGSIAEECAESPGKYNLTLSQCSQLLVN